MKFSLFVPLSLSAMLATQLAEARVSSEMIRRSLAERHASAGQVQDGHVPVLAKKDTIPHRHRRHHESKKMKRACSPDDSSASSSNTRYTSGNGSSSSSGSSSSNSDDSDTDTGSTASVSASNARGTSRGSSGTSSSQTSSSTSKSRNGNTSNSGSSSSSGSSNSSTDSSSSSNSDDDSSSSSTSSSSSGTTSASGSVSGFSGTNTGIGSWFRTNSAQDSTNGRSWCQLNYQDSWMGFAPDVSVMLKSGDTATAGKAYCGREAKATNPSNGKTALIYIVDGFDPKWVKTPGSIDLTLAAFEALYGSDPNGDKNKVIMNLQWEFTGNVKQEFTFNSGS